ncbi:MAG: MFS transporter, partial [Parvibaculaceae bacterium]
MSTSNPARASAEFIALMALTFSLVAMSIDGMLPALGDIAADLSVADPNDRQLVLAAFFAGLSIGQFIYGPISDSTGRKPAMYAGIGCFILGGLMCASATSFSMMLLGRVLQGFGAAGPRIVGTAMVRDLYAGSPMARIMSFVMAVLMVVPVLAPSVGQVILLIADWRAIFYGLAIAGMIDFAWLARRRPETL